MNLLNLLINRLNRDSISEFLLTGAYDQERKLYYNDKDSTCGFIVEVDPVNAIGSQTIDGLAAFLSAKWPKNSICQMLLYSDPNLDFYFDGYRKLRGRRDEAVINEEKDLLFSWANGYASYLENKRFDGIDPREVPVPFRNFRSFITAKIPCSMSQFESRSTDIQTLIENRDSLLGTLSTSHFGVRDVLPDEYIRLMYQIWNPGHPYPLPLRIGEDFKTKFRANEMESFYMDEAAAESRSRRPLIGWDTSLELHKQIVATDTLLKRHWNYVYLDGYYIQTKTPARYPETISPIDFNLLIGDVGRANKRQITSTFILGLTLDLNNQETAISKKGNLVLAQQNALPGLRAKIEKRHKEFQQASVHFEAGDKIIQGTVCLALYARSKAALASVSAQADAIWQNQGYRLQNETFLHLPLFMSCSPLGATSEVFTKLKRSRPAPAETCARMAPLQADSRESGSRPVLPLISRRGQMFSLDLRNSTSPNYNAFVAATSGSGKSFFINAFTTSVLSMNGRAFIIDIGRSYQKLCEVVGGQYIEFTRDSNISLNIFSRMTYDLWHASTKEHMANRDELLNICLSIIVQMASPKTPATSIEEALLRNSLTECFDAMANNTDFFTIDKLIALLKIKQNELNSKAQSDNTPWHLAERLFAFSSKGPHAAWFNSPYNIEFDKSLVVLELEELNAAEDLKQVVLMLIMASIEQKLYLQPDKSRDSYVILDEAWAMLSGENTAKFIEEGYRRARKYGGGYITITQSVFDIRDKNPAIADAIFANSAWKIFLQPKEEEIRRAVKENVISISDEYSMSQVLSTHTSSGRYSEICFIDPQGAITVGRLHVNKVTELMFTTNPLEIAFLGEIKKRGYTLVQALEIGAPLLSILRQSGSIGEAMKYVLHPGGREISDLVSQTQVV